MAIGKWTHPNLDDSLAEPMNEIRMCVAEWMKEYTHGVKEGGKEYPDLQSLAQELRTSLTSQREDTSRGQKATVDMRRQALGASLMVLD